MALEMALDARRSEDISRVTVIADILKTHIPAHRLPPLA
jgi:hypothetical protein